MKKSHAIVFAVAALLAVTGPVAQVQPGQAAYSHLAGPGFGFPIGGIGVFDTVLGGFAPVTGLPVALTGSYVFGNQVGGANAILVNDDDGSIVAANTSSANAAQIAIFHLVLTGTAVTGTQTLPLGSVPTGGGVDQMAWLPGGLVLFSHRYVVNPVLAPQGLGILDLATGLVTSVPITPFPGGTINAATVSRDFQTAYFGVFFPQGSVPLGQIWSVPLAGGVPTLVTSFPSRGLYQLDVDDMGNVVAATFGNGLFVVDPTTGAATQVSPVNQPNGMTIDRTSGRVLVVPSEPNSQVQSFEPNTWVGTVIPGLPAATGTSGLAVRRTMTTYGMAAPSALGTARWVIDPNPGGAPRSGNLGFSMTVEMAGLPVGILPLSLGSWPGVTIPGLPATNVLVDPSLLLGIVVLAPAAINTVALPLPPGLSPFELYAQVFHFENGSFVGGEGLAISLH